MGSQVMINTYWESCIDNVKVISFQVLDIREDLLQVAEIDSDTKKSETRSLAQNELGDFEFSVSIVI